MPNQEMMQWACWECSRQFRPVSWLMISRPFVRMESGRVIARALHLELEP